MLLLFPRSFKAPSQHLFSCHKHEQEVMEIAEIEKKTSEGTKRFDIKINRIRLKGYFYHNLKALKCGGLLKVMRRPGPEEAVDHKNFTPCVHCLGFILKNDLCRHTAIDPLNEERKLKKDNEQVHRSIQHESELLYLECKRSPALPYVKQFCLR